MVVRYRDNVVYYVALFHQEIMQHSTVAGLDSILQPKHILVPIHLLVSAYYLSIFVQLPHQVPHGEA